MTTQNPATATEKPKDQGVGLVELASSIIRFTNAVTLFSMQQMQNALGTVTDSQAVISRFCDALDAMSNSLATQIDAAKKSTLDSMSSKGSEMVDRTMHVMNVQALNPRDSGHDGRRHAEHDCGAQLLREPIPAGVTDFFLDNPTSELRRSDDRSSQ